MPRGLELTPSTLSTERMSAPSSADFFIQRERQRKTKRYRPPILRGLHDKKVPTLESGLVDMEGLRLYMHRNPFFVPLYKTAGWKYHHVNHSKSSFKQANTLPNLRDENLSALRNSSYQQVHLRITNELIYHLAHEIDVDHPPAESVSKGLKDIENIDMLGAACLFLNLTRGNNQYRVDIGSLTPAWAGEIPLKERIDFISEVREDYSQAIVRAEILPHRVVTSAVKRLSMHLQDPYLGAVAGRRLASDPVFYPLRVPSHKTLLDKANRLMALEFQFRQEEADLPLQTGVDEVQLAA